MAESPDFLPIEFSPYPPSPASYVTFETLGNATFAGPLHVHDFNDGKLYLLKNVAASCTATLTAAAVGLEIVTLSLSLANGLSDNGSIAYLDSVNVSLLPGGVGANGGAAYVQLQAPSPIVIQAHGSAGVQFLQVGADGTHSTASYVVTALCWPLN